MSTNWDHSWLPSQQYIKYLKDYIHREEIIYQTVGPGMVTGELKWHIEDPTLQTTKALKLTEEKEKKIM